MFVIQNGEHVQELPLRIYHKICYLKSIGNTCRIRIRVRVRIRVTVRIRVRNNKPYAQFGITRGNISSRVHDKVNCIINGMMQKYRQVSALHGHFLGCMYFTFYHCHFDDITLF